MNILKYSFVIIVIIIIYCLMQLKLDGYISWSMVIIFIILGVLGYFVDKKRGKS